MGGNTAFPMLGVAVKPVKGSAILWGNLHPDGKIARDTLHGACPVIYGIKSIATKWIHANDQMFTRQNCKRSKLSFHFDFSDES
ncbi:Prolyl 4-hydroxylase subunit alpha-1 [Orchesella cincta]|uniref:Prolyl 4-hydroxylase subunit alpha-1 n=1 Tax=Orchesella cincta TaxID=48709 RepID=A0A1D2N6V5_ORCCI|nr:Prolyl 4-hydroxylase subunit alpha-1 [Orchesella cincta]